MQRTDIEWADYSANPLKLKLRESGKLVNACIRVSAGCQKCYAESIVRRYWPKAERKFPGYSAALMKLGDPIINEVELQKMLTFRPKPPFKSGERPGVFVCDMTDAFGDWVPFELLDRMFAVFALRPDVDWTLLTKRPERSAEYFSASPTAYSRIRAIVDGDNGSNPILETWWKSLNRHQQENEQGKWYTRLSPTKWPLPNVWLGTSVEDQQRADERIPHLLRCPAAVRFLSVEPMLGPVDLKATERAASDAIDPEWRDGRRGRPLVNVLGSREFEWEREPGIHWTICGSESGPGRRPMSLDWARSLRDQCAAAGVAFFMKQLERDGKITGDMERFPADLRVREFPKAKASV